MNTHFSMGVSLRAIVLLSLLGFSFAASAKTWHVGKHGANDPGCGSKTSPCLSINHVLGLAGNNDRIIVGPGKYVENLDITIEGLKLESTAGRWGTIIEASSGSDHVIYIAASKVQIGKKGKGFTLQGANASPVAGIWVDPDVVRERLKIEGNRVTENYYGIIIQNFTGAGATPEEIAAYPSKPQVRHNYVVGNTTGYGIFCYGCGGGQILDNRIENNGPSSGNPLYVDYGNKTTIYRNVVSNNGGSYSQLGGYVRQARVKDNVFDKDNTIGFVVLNGDGVQVQSNILAQSGTGGPSIGLYLNQSTNNKPLQAKNNLVVASSGSNIYFAGIGQDLQFEGNTSVDAGDNAIEVTGTPTFKRFRSNSSIASTGCGIEVAGGLTLKHEKHFFADNGGGDTCGAGTIDPTSTTANKPSPLKVNKARSL